MKIVGLNTEKTKREKHMKKYMTRLAYGVKLAIVLALGGFLQMAAHGKSTPFSRIIVFGDSLSDTGNFYHLTGGRLPPEPYFEGRFSDGPLWVEYLAEALGMQLFAEDDYAVAGATTGHDNLNNGVLGLSYPGMQDQITEFLMAHQAGGADPDALYVLWAGANDFFVTLQSGGDPAALIGGGISNTVRAVQTLWQAGARNILVVNVPDLGLTPYGLASGLNDAITHLCFVYDETLDGVLATLAGAGVPTIRVDAFASLENMVDHPTSFGFTNVTQPLLQVGGDAEEFLFWDLVHPTTLGHEGFANAAVQGLIDYYSPRNGNGFPPALVNSLNGLVRKSKP
jgi:phospholipase/lecithinase/hemolysin